MAEKELSLDLKRKNLPPSHLTAFKRRRKGKQNLAFTFVLHERKRPRSLGNSTPPASLPHRNLQPQERDLPKTDSKGNPPTKEHSLLPPGLSQWTLPAPLSAHHCVFQGDQLPGAGAGPMSPAPLSVSHTSDCQGHFFIYKLIFSSKK